MPEITISETINAPRERVFGLATDFASLADRIQGIDSTEVLTEGPVAVGTRFRETRTMLGKKATEEMTVASFDPPQSFSLTAASCGSNYLSTYTLTDSGGGTEIRMTFGATPVSFFAKVMGIFSRLMMAACMKAIAKDLADLKIAAESDPS